MQDVLVSAVVAAVACVPPRPGSQPSPERPRYSVSLRVDPSFRRVDGTLAATFTPNRPTSRLVFRLWPNGPPQLADGSRLDVGAVTSGGASLLVARPDPTTLIVRLRRTLAS